MAFATHKFFNDRGFVYVHTPLITAADCEGAGEQVHACVRAFLGICMCAYVSFVTSFDKCPANCVHSLLSSTYNLAFLW